MDSNPKNGTLITRQRPSDLERQLLTHSRSSQVAPRAKLISLSQAPALDGGNSSSTMVQPLETFTTTELLMSKMERMKKDSKLSFPILRVAPQVKAGEFFMLMTELLTEQRVSIRDSA
jgi:hypothetical protein